LNEFDRAQALDPYISTFYYDAARTLSLAGEGDKAITILKKVATKDEHYHLAYGDLLERKGDEAGALPEYEEAIKINPLSSQGFYGKGKILLGQKKFPEAGQAFQAAFGAQPTFPEAHQGMAEVLLEGKKYEDAAAEYEQSLSDMMQSQATRDQVIAARDDYTSRMKKTKGFPKALLATFEDDCKKIIH
jgi:tetratricopeptide (TPR) repeat protein